MSTFIWLPNDKSAVNMEQVCEVDYPSGLKNGLAILLVFTNGDRKIVSGIDAQSVIAWLFHYAGDWAPYEPKAPSPDSHLESAYEERTESVE